MTIASGDSGYEKRIGDINDIFENIRRATALNNLNGSQTCVRGFAVFEKTTDGGSDENIQITDLHSVLRKGGGKRGHNVADTLLRT